MQEISLVVGHYIYQTQKVLFGGKIATHVQHESPEGKIRPVGNHRGGYRLPLGVSTQVFQGLGGVERTVFIGCFHQDFLSNGEPIPAGHLAFHHFHRLHLCGGQINSPSLFRYLFYARNHIIHRCFHLIVLK